MLALMIRVRRLLPLPLALLVLAAFALPRSVEAQAAQPEDASAVVAAVQQLRAQAGLPAFRLDAGLQRAAQRHSLDMADHGELLHVSARTGDPARRVSDEGVRHQRVAENVARASSALAAQESIVGSAAHRAQLLDGELTHLGVAAARAPDGSVYLTEVMARLDLAQAVAPSAIRPAAPAAPAPALVPPTPMPAPSAIPAPTTAVPMLPRGVQPAPYVPAPPPPMAMAPATPGPVTAPATPTSQIAGYWVFSNARWYYYPLPPGAQPGQRLAPDLSVQGPPPGYAGYGARAAAAPPVTGAYVTGAPVTGPPSSAAYVSGPYVSGPYVTGPYVSGPTVSGTYIAPAPVFVRRHRWRSRRWQPRSHRGRVRVVRPAPIAPGGRVIIYAR